MRFSIFYLIISSLVNNFTNINTEMCLEDLDFCFFVYWYIISPVFSKKSEKKINFKFFNVCLLVNFIKNVAVYKKPLCLPPVLGSNWWPNGWSHRLQPHAVRTENRRPAKFDISRILGAHGTCFMQ